VTAKSGTWHAVPAPQQPSLALAERVAATAAELGIETALIGAMALAANNFLRGSQDVDLASNVDPFTQLRALERTLAEQGLNTRLFTPDDHDDLGGKLVVWEYEDEDEDPIDPCEVVNFTNPFRRRKTPAASALRSALPLGPGSSLRYVRLPDLIAFKLDTGARKDQSDVVQLLVHNPDADLDEIRAIAGPFDRANVLESLILEAAQTQR
jgi:hypothetical protein